MAIRKERTEIYVGLFVFFGLAVMGALIVQYGRFSDRLQEKYLLSVTFKDASGIIEGSPVRLAGQKIGYVAADPALNDDFTAVVISLNIYADRRIPRGSKFTIATSGLMGDTYIAIEMAENPGHDYLKDGEQVAGAGESGLASLQDDADKVLKDIRLAVKDIQTAVKSLDRVFQKIEHDLLADQNMENLKGTFDDLKKSGENIKSATEKLDPLVNEAKDTVTEARTTMTKAGDAFDRAKEVIGKAEPAVEDLQPAIAELKETIAKANETVGRISHGNGVAAALISDSELKADLTSFIDKLNRYGILGYPKDKDKDEDRDSFLSRGREAVTPSSRANYRSSSGDKKEKDESDDKPGLLHRLFSDD